MKLSRRSMTEPLCYSLMSALFVTLGLLVCTDVRAEGKHEYSVKNEYSATEIVIPNNLIETGENGQAIICEEAIDGNATVELKAIAETAQALVDNNLLDSSAEYQVPISTAPELHSGEVKEGEYITFNLDDLMVYVDAEYDNFEWDTRNRIKDIYILKELLVNQLHVSPTKAAAIIGNICCEDSFAGLTNSKASLSSLSEAKSKLGNGSRGYGIVQWTASYRQKSLEEYYTAIHSDLSWELTSVIAETAYLYNELYVSGVIGDLSEDGDLEDLTGKLGCEYEAYAKSSQEWYKQNGQYKTTGSSRYTYAKHVYDLICEGMQ